MTRIPLVERAYQLAESGNCRGIDDITSCLVAEGYMVGRQLHGTVGNILTKLCLEAGLPSDETVIADEREAASLADQPDTGNSNHHPSIIERAYELAASGRYHDVEDIRRCLSLEGYLNVLEHTAGGHIRQALLGLCRDARNKTEADVD